MHVAVTTCVTSYFSIYSTKHNYRARLEEELCYAAIYVLEAAGNKVDENWVTVFQDGSQVLGSRPTFTTFAVGDATWIALGI